MRIRTIKPDFWVNEKMSGLPDFTRLLAIGLLNYADDEGYFWANPLLLRGALFPFDEDSSRLRRSLEQLAAEGYIRLGESSDGRACGQIVNFAKHQRIDRPKPSDISPLARFDDESTNDRRTIDDESLLEGKGKEGKGKEQGRDSDHAQQIYDAYPRRVGKQAALKAICAASRLKPMPYLLERTQAYAAAVTAWSEADKQFIPHPATWFNRGSYEDDPATWTRTGGKPQPLVGTYKPAEGDY